ncbi:phage tail fiber protein, partial [Proteus mirabilis]
GYKDGDPIDIPDGRFISVRVQMPEQSIYNVRMREMEEAQKAEEERRKKEEEMKEQYGLGENDVLL